MYKVCKYWTMKSKNVVYPVMLVIFFQTRNTAKNVPKVYSVL